MYMYKLYLGFNVFHSAVLGPMGAQEVEEKKAETLSWEEPEDCTVTKDEFYRCVQALHSSKDVQALHSFFTPIVCTIVLYSEVNRREPDVPDLVRSPGASQRQLTRVADRSGDVEHESQGSCLTMFLEAGTTGTIAMSVGSCKEHMSKARTSVQGMRK